MIGDSWALLLALLLPSLSEGASPDAPDGYTPARVSCPNPQPSIRAATGLSTNETEWLSRREDMTVSSLKDFLGRANIRDLDTSQYIDSISSNGSALPRIGIAISGGGYRALMNGAGAIAAFDNRTANSTGAGQLGGLLQAATYLSGLSGGSWLVGSIYTQNFSTVDSIISERKLWQFDDSIFEGPSDISAAKYYDELFRDVENKHDVGFNVSITDYWGRALSYQLVNETTGGPAYTFSSIARDSQFQQGQWPMPIILAVERQAGQIEVPLNSTIFEFTPWEMGSYDPGTAAFAPLKFIGSNFTDGTIDREGECIAGFDNAGFVMGTSSSLFNQALLQITDTSGVPDILTNAINRTLQGLNEGQDDIALWPNPFFQYKVGVYDNANSTNLTLVDGGESLQNIPLHPLTLTARHVDVIFAVDGSADTSTDWPNGTALVATFNASQIDAPSNNTQFPPVPDQNTFINLGLNQRPTFFGCNSTNPGPLIVYLPNFPFSFHSNVSTFDLEFSDDDRSQIIQNGYDVATRGNGTLDSAWATCVACAVLERSLTRSDSVIPPDCVDCFTRYCWNGTTNSTLPNTYEPQLVQESESKGVRLSGSAGGYACAVLILILSLVFM